MRSFLCLLCVLFSFPLMAAETSSMDNDPYFKSYEKDYAAAYRFQKALAAGDREKVARMVSYPLALELPLKPIKNSKEFIKHWDWFFIDKNIPSLTDPKEVTHMSWHGVVIESGGIWFYGERVSAINSWTPAFSKALQTAKLEEQARFHPSVGVYESVAKFCETDTKQVRIHSIKTAEGNDYRLIIWDKKSKFSDKPLEVIDHAEYESMGTAHNEQWDFTKGDLTYELQTKNVCEEDCNEYLTIRRGNEEVSKEVCPSRESLY